MTTKRNIISNYMRNSLLTLVSISITFVGLEMAYRIRMNLNGAFDHKYRVSSFVYGRFDENHGVKYPPNKKATFFNITAGKVTWCPEAISISNKDGINGKTTVEEYESADIKVLVFGDSFTHWNRRGYTWPDLLQELLAEKLDKDVKVLNYGRGTYGVLQMFDLAADKIVEHQPDLVVFAFITDDLTRARWWRKAFMIDGYEGPLLSPNKDVFNLTVATDTYLVNPLVNLDWCRKTRDSKRSNPILDQVEEQYRKIRKMTFAKRGVRENTFFSIHQSYLFNRFVLGDIFPAKTRPLIPRIDFNDFSSDRRFLEKVEKIGETNTPYFLFHLQKEGVPESSSVLEGNEKMALLLSSLERITHKEVIFIHKRINRDKEINKISLLPHDGHPNFHGLKLYAESIASYLSTLR